jgi:hypothetical protein
MPSNSAPLLLWRREPQACGAVRWFLYRGLRRTRWFIERPAHACDRLSRSLRYVLCRCRPDRPGSASAEGAFGTLELARLRAEQEAMEDTCPAPV